MGPAHNGVENDGNPNFADFDVWSVVVSVSGVFGFLLMLTCLGVAARPPIGYINNLLTVQQRNYAVLSVAIDSTVRALLVHSYYCSQ